jgi:hypothetical protein
MTTGTMPAVAPIGVDGAEAGLAPAGETATTVAVYSVDEVSPGMTAEVWVPGTVVVAPPGLTVTR